MSIPIPMSVLLLGVFVLLAGCERAHNDTITGEEAGSDRAEDTVLGDMAGTLDRAESVEGTLQEQKRDLDRAIDEASGG